MVDRSKLDLENAIEIIDSPIIVMTDETQLWNDKIQSLHEVIHNIPNHNMHQDRQKYGQLVEGHAQIFRDNQENYICRDVNLSPRSLKEIKFAMKGKK